MKTQRAFYRARFIRVTNKVIKMLTELKVLLTYCILIEFMLLVQAILTVRQHGFKPLIVSRDGIEFFGIAD